MAKVYVLTINSVSDYSGSEEIKAYSTKKKAQAAMRERYKAEKDDWESAFGDEGIDYDYSAMEASIQRRYEYARDHIDYLITECEIE